ncbi:hypothetical protein KI811_07915 [Geobacter hydrogenophilus]|uniref:Uncharacterized protein n=1 Tax=Geobacter hydrogenophilus TaxID=40983 RepID=A0A9W6FZE0_9BACT|nr:hypothetical protein [Geobacter hydrogenophilus]MBT0893736.1 hypothetical protein [Geobacter hydrogenophilus]GLI37568.1 hypothetical protein GHYDROH2_10690 [Geobacter hydrogenophilus]
MESIIEVSSVPDYLAVLVQKDTPEKSNALLVLDEIATFEADIEEYAANQVVGATWLNQN